MSKPGKREVDFIKTFVIITDERRRIKRERERERGRKRERERKKERERERKSDDFPGNRLLNRRDSLLELGFFPSFSLP